MKQRGRKRVVQQSVLPLISQAESARKRLRLSTDAIAFEHGLNATTIGRWERGVMDPGLSKFAAYAKSVGYKLVLAPLEQE